MNDEAKQLLMEALKNVLASLQSGADFAKQQIPLVIQEKLAYDWYYYLFFTTLWTGLWVIAGIWCVYWVRSYYAQKQWYDEEWRSSLGYLPFAFMTIALLAALGNNISAMIQISVAPHLYLLEWLRGFIK